MWDAGADEARDPVHGAELVEDGAADAGAQKVSNLTPRSRSNDSMASFRPKMPAA